MALQGGLCSPLWELGPWDMVWGAVPVVLLAFALVSWKLGVHLPPLVSV